jgi:hypothetical protein
LHSSACLPEFPIKGGFFDGFAFAAVAATVKEKGRVFRADREAEKESLIPVKNGGGRDQNTGKNASTLKQILSA